MADIEVMQRHGRYSVLSVEHHTTMRRSGNRQYWHEYQVRRGSKIVARHDRGDDASLDAQRRAAKEGGF